MTINSAEYIVRTREVRVFWVAIYPKGFRRTLIWAFCPELLRAFAPKEYLTPSDISDGNILEATLEDIHMVLDREIPVTSLIPKYYSRA